MSDLRERAIKDVAEASLSTVGDCERRLREGDYYPLTVYAVSQRELVLRLEEKLAQIAGHMNADDENSYRADDPEGAMDTVYSIALEGK